MSQQQAEATNFRAVTRCAMVRVCPHVSTRSKPRGCERVPTLQGRAVVVGAGGCGACGQGSLVGCWAALCRVDECGCMWMARRCFVLCTRDIASWTKRCWFGQHERALA